MCAVLARQDKLHSGMEGGDDDEDDIDYDPMDIPGEPRQHRSAREKWYKPRADMFFVLRFYDGAGNVTREYRSGKPLVEWRETMTRETTNLIIERFDTRDTAPFRWPMAEDTTAATAASLKN
jgi:hypothetical protein